MPNTTDDALAAFLAKGGAITKCPTREGNATPLRRLRQQADAAIDAGQAVNVLARDASGRVDPSADAREYNAAESDTECRMEQAGAMAASGQRCVGFDSHGNAVSAREAESDLFGR
jgi:hypothetical protein